MNVFEPKKRTAEQEASLEGCTPESWEELNQDISVVRFTHEEIILTKRCIEMLPAKRFQLLINVNQKAIALRPCDDVQEIKGERRSVEVWPLCNALYNLMGWDKKLGYEVIPEVKDYGPKAVVYINLNDAKVDHMPCD